MNASGSLIDCHTHAFPDNLAGRAVPLLEQEGNVRAALDGTVGSLLRSMDEAGIATSIVASIATKPTQFRPILQWSLSIASPRIVPFASVHPDDPEAASRIEEIAAAGLRGIKLHPYYQRFVIDEERMLPLYDAAERAGLILLMHTGFDIAFPRDRIADPARILRVLERHPDLRLIASHFGAWEDWDEVERLLLGKPVYMDVSYSLPFLDPDRARSFILSHPTDLVLFGSDSPWTDQRQAVESIRALDLPNDVREALFFANAKRLLA